MTSEEPPELHRLRAESRQLCRATEILEQVALEQPDVGFGHGAPQPNQDQALFGSWSNLAAKFPPETDLLLLPCK
jgi:hypothetical protein